MVGTEYRYHDAYCGDDCRFGQIMGMPEAFYAPVELVDKAVAACDGMAVHKGLIASGEWFVDTRNKMRAIIARMPAAVAVDMESCSIAQTCHIYGVRLLGAPGRRLVQRDEAFRRRALACCLKLYAV